MVDRLELLALAKDLYGQALDGCAVYKLVVENLAQPNSRLLKHLEQELRDIGLSYAKTSLLRNQREDLSKPGIIKAIEDYEAFISQKLEHLKKNYF